MKGVVLKQLNSPGGGKVTVWSNTMKVDFPGLYSTRVSINPQKLLQALRSQRIYSTRQFYAHVMDMRKIYTRGGSKQVWIQFHAGSAAWKRRCDLMVVSYRSIIRVLKHLSKKS